MRVLIFGASGMVGQGVLRECLAADDVTAVRAVGRSSIAQRSGKLDEVVVPDLHDLGSVADRLTNFDACFYCAGPSAAGMSEAEYSRATYDLTVGAATTLAKLNTAMTFVYVSGSGTDSTEKGRVMWARVKGRTENALLRLPFRRAYMFRPGMIQPLHGITSKTKSYRIIYSIMGPVLPALKSLFPNAITTTEQVGRAMLAVARNGYSKPLLDARDINSL